MRRAQSNSPRIPPKKHHSFNLPGDTSLSHLLLLPGYKPRSRPPSYPAQSSHSKERLLQFEGNNVTVPCIRVSCASDPAPDFPYPILHHPEARRRSPEGRVQESRGRSPGRLVSQGDIPTSCLSNTLPPPLSLQRWTNITRLVCLGKLSFPSLLLFLPSFLLDVTFLSLLTIFSSLAPGDGLLKKPCLECSMF